MASLRLQLAILAACAWFPTYAPAQQLPVWQPYRTVIPHIVPQPVGPPSYVTSVVDVPIDVISDPELEEMCVPCGEPLLGRSVPHYYFTAPVYSNAPFGDPVLAPLANAPVWNWRLLPDDLIWHSYWAGTKEPRISGTLFEEVQDDVTLFDVTFGGRTSVLRYGTVNQGRPEGWELQLESAAMLRLNLDEDWDLEAVDFRIGVPLVYGQGRSQWKFSYYHLSSHLGDEIAIREGILDTRINFSRDVLVVAYSLFPVPALRLYSEAGWAFHTDEGSNPWEFQFGVNYAQPGATGCRGTPFFAINGHLREELNYGGNFVVQGGWLWRGKGQKIVRTGVHYYNGKSNQFEFFDEFEQQIGVGLWHEY